MNHPLAPQIAAVPGPMVDILSPDGLILGADPVQAAQLGLTAEALEGADWARIYTLDARDRIAALFAQGTAAITPAVLPMVLRMATGATLATAAVADPPPPLFRRRRRSAIRRRSAAAVSYPPPPLPLIRRRH